MISWWIVLILIVLTYATSAVVTFYVTSKHINNKWKKRLDENFVIIEKDKLEQIGVAIEKFLKE